MIMNETIALDTNVLIYLHDSTDTLKHDKALELMAMMPIVSSQVVSEYLNVLRRILKVHKTKLLGEAITWLAVCQIIPVTFSTLQTAHSLIGTYDFQMFDSIVVAAALQANCTILYSEDMHHGLVVENQLSIINPFL